MQEQFAADISGSDVKSICERILKSVSLKNNDEVCSKYVSNLAGL